MLYRSCIETEVVIPFQTNLTLNVLTIGEVVGLELIHFLFSNVYKFFSNIANNYRLLAKSHEALSIMALT